MTARRTILDSVRRHHFGSLELPSLDGPWITYEDRKSQFACVLEGVGGRAVFVASYEEAHRELESISTYQDARRICTQVAGVGTGNVDLDAIDDPHELADVDFAVIVGEIAVAENAAVWVTDAGMKHRVLPFITQHLAIVVAEEDLVDNMHEAYDRLSFTDRSFGAFISGPSKTADIEQSLVIGAHGPRSLTVFVIAK